MTNKAFVLLTITGLAIATGCQKKSGNLWEDNQTGAHYSHKNSSALWGNSDGGDTLAGNVQEDFIPLSDEDLKNQFADAAVAQPSKSLGENGMPSADEFHTPTGALASIFTPVFFKTDEYSVKNAEALAKIKEMADYLKKNPTMAVIVEGHCDERGPEAYNMALGTKRANYVRSLLVKQGVHPDQLHTISYGKENPFVHEHNAEAWSQNRRAHFRVYKR